MTLNGFQSAPVYPFFSSRHLVGGADGDEVESDGGGGRRGSGRSSALSEGGNDDNDGDDSQVR